VLLSSLGGGRKTRAPPPPALAGIDLRLRAGLPLLVPEEAIDRDEDEEKDKDDESEVGGLVVKLEYRHEATKQEKKNHVFH
jgi:hypothetical protein